MSSGPRRWRSPSKADGNYSPEEQSGAKAIYTSALAKWRHLRFQKVGFHCCAIHSRLPNARGGAPLVRSRPGGCWSAFPLLSLFTEERECACSCQSPSVLLSALPRPRRPAGWFCGIDEPGWRTTPPPPPYLRPRPSLHLSWRSLKAVVQLTPHATCAATAQGPFPGALLLHPSTWTEESEPV